MTERHCCPGVDMLLMVMARHVASVGTLDPQAAKPDILAHEASSIVTKINKTK